MYEKSSFSPKTDRLEQLFQKPEPLSEEEKKEMSKLLAELRLTEKDASIKQKNQEYEEIELEKVLNSTYYENALETVKEVKALFSNAYLVDIDYDERDRLQKAKFNIRTSGKQHRHITPVAIVEKIIKNTLKKGASVEEICKNLLYKMEFFYSINNSTLSKETNDYVQTIFDYFKKPGNINPQNVKFLIKLSAHFYNQILIVMSDQYIDIPYTTNDCYLIPTLEFASTSKKYHHATEGSFISGQIKILKGFNSALKDKKIIKKTQIHQMIYSILSIFDFMPLPEDAKNPKNIKLNTDKHRYVAEPIERLGIVCSNHLLFISEAYPLLWNVYKKEIITGFLKFVSYGISKNDLRVILDQNSEKGVIAKLKLGKLKSLDDFTNQKFVCGFAKQYAKIYQNRNDFLKKLSILVKGKVNFYYEKESKSPLKKNEPNKEQIRNKEMYNILKTQSAILANELTKNIKFSGIHEKLLIVDSIIGINNTYSLFEEVLLIFIKDKYKKIINIKILDKKKILSDKYDYIIKELFEKTGERGVEKFKSILMQRLYDKAIENSDIVSDNYSEKSIKFKKIRKEIDNFKKSSDIKINKNLKTILATKKQGSISTSGFNSDKRAASIIAEEKIRNNPNPQGSDSSSPGSNYSSLTPTPENTDDTDSSLSHSSTTGPKR